MSLFHKKNNLEAVALDLETTGLGKQAEIIEIAAIRFSLVDWKKKSMFHSLIKPNYGIPEFITKLTNISDNDVKSSNGVEVVMGKFQKWLNEMDVPLLIGHNIIDFDRKFLERNLLFTDNISYCDTLVIGREYLKYPKYPVANFKLQTLCNFFNINYGSHRAIGDAESAMQLYYKLWQGFGKTDNGMLL